MRIPTSKEKAALRNAAQKLKPAIHVGKRGVTPALVEEFEKSLKADQLIKVAFRADRAAIPPMIEELESKTSCFCVGGVGKRRSFFRSPDT